jgi:tetrahydromethanopterin S-methyltransferase subunit A
MIIAAAVFVGGWLGAVVANRVSGPYLRLAFGIFVVVLGISERSGGLDGSEIEGLHRSSVAESAKTSVAATGWVSFVANTSESSGTKGAADRRCST